MQKWNLSFNLSMYYLKIPTVTPMWKGIYGWINYLKTSYGNLPWRIPGLQQPACGIYPVVVFHYISTQLMRTQLGIYDLIKGAVTWPTRLLIHNYQVDYSWLVYTVRICRAYSLGIIHNPICLLVVILCHSNSISVICWQWYVVWDEKEKSRAYLPTQGIFNLPHHIQ